MANWQAERLSQLPPYLFVEIDRKRRAAIDAGKDVINFGIGDPDKPTPHFIIESMATAIRDPKNHPYPPGTGIPEFRKAATDFFHNRFGVKLDPGTEWMSLIGTKEGLGHLPLACVNPGDTVLIPQPGYPVYISATVLAGGKPYYMDLAEERGWLPDLDAIPTDVSKSAKLMFLNYPNNPTAACAPLSFFEEAVAFARKHEILIVQDAAYSEVYFNEPPPSILQVKGATDVAVEFHSLSKTFNMTGWRIGFAAGNAEVLGLLAKVKSNVDSGQFMAVQHAAVEAISHTDHVEVRAMLDVYRERRDTLCSGLRDFGFDVNTPNATFFVWVKCPDGHDSMSVVSKFLEEAAVVVIPGVGFGKPGDNYFRLALTVKVDRIKEALERIKKVSF